MCEINFIFLHLAPSSTCPFYTECLSKKNVCDPFKSIWPKYTESVLRLLWGHVIFLFQFLVKCKKFPRVWNRLMHGAGVSYVGLLWSCTSNYSITLIYFLNPNPKQDISKRKRLTGGMQRAGCRTVVFYQQNKGSVWLNLLNWSKPQKKNNDYYDMALGALLWLTIPLKTIIKLTCVGRDGLTLGRDELRSSINHEFYVVTQKNNHKVILDMWFEFVVGSCRCSKCFSPGPPVFLPL